MDDPDPRRGMSDSRPGRSLPRQSDRGGCCVVCIGGCWMAKSVGRACQPLATLFLFQQAVRSGANARFTRIREALWPVVELWLKKLTTL